MARHLRNSRWWILGLGIVIASGAVLQQTRFGTAKEVLPPIGENGGENGSHAVALQTERSRTRVVVVKPTKGGIPRSTTQPVTMESFDWADLFGKVSGYVKEQSVDIGDMVKRGQVLAIIDMPELYSELERAKSAKIQADAQVTLMQARVVTAEADLEAARAAIELAEAELVKATSYLKFREIQYDRIKKLFEKQAIDERLVDEKHEQRDAAQAAELTAKAAINSAKAQAAAAAARVTQAQATVADAQAKVKVDEALVGKAEVFVQYTKIISPYTGVVTKRNFHVGDFIRAADQGGIVPLLTVARTDLMRVIVQVPERDVPYTDVGDQAILEMDSLQGEKLPGKVSRIANSEDRLTRTMRTEIDIENPGNRLRDGMFGRATIYIEKGTKGLTVPVETLVGQGKGKKAAVFMVRDGKASRTSVEIGQDDGVRVEILSGLSPDDQVILRPAVDLTDGAAVEVDLAAETAPNNPATAKSSRG